MSELIGGNAKEQIKSIVERVERIETELKGLQTGKSEIFQEAKSNGLDVKALRTIIRMRKMDSEERLLQDAILETYMQALGMV